MYLDQLLVRKNPYEDFDPSQFDVGLRWGFGSADDTLTHVIERLRPELIIEVGSWEGGSAIYMAREIKRLGLPTKIICVDTWLGAPEHVLQEGFRGTLGERFGYPTLYHRFIGNVLAAGAESIISPLPNTSDNAAQILRHLGVKAQMVFVDAAHEYLPVSRDLEAYWDLLTEDGALVGDDYIGWPEVTQAADDFARKHSIPLYGRFGKYVMQKGARLTLPFGELKEIAL